MTRSYAAGAGTPALLGETIGESLDRAAERFGDAEALVVAHQSLRYTYAELALAVDQLARALVGLGLAKGDRIGIWSPNCAEWTVLQLATAKAGLILVNINPAYRASELEYVLNQSGCRLLVSAVTFKSSDYREMISSVSGSVERLERTIFIGSEEWAELVDDGAGRAGDQLARREATLDFDDPINIQYTSGTTGFPKGATLTHHNILNNGYLVGHGCRYTSADRVCIPVPLYHCFGMVMGNLACVTHGATMLYPAPAFEPTAVLETVQAEAATSLYGVPTMFIAALDHPDFDDFDLSSLRTGIMAGSPCPVEVMRRVIDEMHMEQVTICYGMTETSPVSTQTGVDDALEKRVATVGRTHPHLEIKVVDPETGICVPRGHPGELLTRGYSVMMGYWDDDQRTAEVIDPARWMHTGDLATMDEDGYLNIVGRSKDMVIRGGENIYPREVEEFLHTHPSIAEVAVFGVPDAKFGEQLAAWIRLRDDVTLDEEAVKEFCRGAIAHYKVPAYVRFTETFPMTVTGKVQKFKLREIAIRDLGLEAELRQTA